jgi:hypothetical protein
MFCGQDFGDLAPIEKSATCLAASIRFETATMSEVAEEGTPRKLRDSPLGFIYESINSNRCGLIWSRKHTSRSPIRSFWRFPARHEYLC